jgi:hypothetical protein
MHLLQISGFANVVKPLTKLTDKKQAFQCALEVEAAFKALKEALCIASVLAFLQPRERFVVDTDMSDVGIGEVEPEGHVFVSQ